MLRSSVVTLEHTTLPLTIVGLDAFVRLDDLFGRVTGSTDLELSGQPCTRDRFKSLDEPFVGSCDDL